MIVSIAIVGLFVVSAVVIAGACRFLSRPIPPLLLAGFCLLAILPFPRAFVSDVTILPLDHAAYTRPWYVEGNPPPYNPYLSDLATQILPWAKATRLAWKDGALPLRNRWNGCGLPLAANGVSAAFSPFTFLALLLPLARSYTLIASLKLLLAATGMWLWARELKASTEAATFAAAAYALSFSFTPPWLIFPQSSVLCLWPWMLFLVERSRDFSGRGRTTALLAVVFSASILAAHPETAALGFLFTALWILARWLFRDLRPIRPVLSALAVAAGLALGLTSFLLVPTFFAIESSGRLAAMAQPYWHSVLSVAPHKPFWREVPTSFLPHTLGNGIGSPLLPLAAAAFPERTLGYFGIVGWTLALLVFRPGSARPRAEWILVGFLLGGFGVAVALWPVAEVASRIPMIRYVMPHRFHSWEALAGSVIAGLEIDRLRRDARARPGFTTGAAFLAPVLVGIAAILVYFHFRAEHAAVGGSLFQKREALLILAVLGVGALLAFLLKTRPHSYALCMTFLCAGELLAQWRGLFRLNSPSLLFPATPGISYLQARPGPFRVLGNQYVLFPNTSVFAGLEDIRTHEAVERRDYLHFLDLTCGYSASTYFKILADVNAPALDFLNVRYLMAEPDTGTPGDKWRRVYGGADATIFENTRALPRAFAPRRIRLVAAADSRSTNLRDADGGYGKTFREIAAMKDWDDIAYVLSDHDATMTNAQIDVLAYTESTNRADIRVLVRSDTQEAFLILSLVQDEGWVAQTATGVDVPVSYANGPFMALRLPRGENHILLAYRPPGMRGGLAAAVATGCLMFFGSWYRRRRDRPREAPGQGTEQRTG